MVFSGTGIEGSSESDCGGAGGGTRGGAARGGGGAGMFKRSPLVIVGFGGGGTCETSDGGGEASWGLSLTVVCLPVVHGGIERNSSNVRHRGLQQFQPM